MTTVFSRIIAGTIPSYKIYEDEYTYAFLDISPLAPGHTLIVPKIEQDKFYRVDEPYYTAVFQTAKKIAVVLEQALGSDRVTAKIIGTDVPHFHLHLIPLSPRYTGKPIKIESVEMEQIADKIRQALQ
jgi:histidine triad (HIT) family protein